MNKVKMFIMDVDGTLTDGRLYIGHHGEEFKAFNVKDGYGIRLLIEKGIIPVIITGRNSRIVSLRAKELGINELFQGVEHKLEVYAGLKEKYELSDQEIAYIGDDLNDLPIIKRVGLSFCVADGMKEVKEQADYVMSLGGGAGAVREAIEILI